ncbi:unnamed protein product [Chondrus crispus]|uniref:Condensin-2 complex subunit H2 C-terminal domain-containing protein n=1 Tax=Chondrus crispus TaxID=2769 RepID=R7Q4L3_CHOCR|nr:unnamed protein product [Chondrus crispus]CDF32400.1 unnamed protein product [Chondrus crispus]|eukprot:XP_005712065.1 unnamed protein product [Chondrus crispus]
MSTVSRAPSQENRYEALLNPIRGLVASWDVDVAKELTYYADSVGISIETVAPSIDSPEQFLDSIDFAEAALVVEGATSLYSRKVKHLYRLVFETVSALIPADEETTDKADGLAVDNANESSLDGLNNNDNTQIFTNDEDSLPVDQKRRITHQEEKELLTADQTCMSPSKPEVSRENSFGGDEIDGHPFSPYQPESFSLRVSKTIKDVAALYGITSEVQSVMNVQPPKDPFLMMNPLEAIPTHVKPVKVGKTYKRTRRSIKTSHIPYYDFRPAEMDTEDLVLGKFSRTASMGNYICCTELKPDYISVQRKRRAQWKHDVSTTEQFLLQKFFQEVDSGPDMESGGYNAIEGIDFDAFGDADDLPAPEFQTQDFENGDALEFQANDDDDGFGSVAPGLEETYREHLERIASLWKQRTVDTDMVKRVEQWTSRIQPLLEEEEHRPKFDISCYEREILSDLNGIVKQKHVFKTRVSMLIREPARFEVCRKFLAMLQLANSYDIEIQSSEGCHVEDFFVKAPLNEREGQNIANTSLAGTESQYATQSPLNEKENEDPLLETAAVAQPRTDGGAILKDRGAKRGRLSGSTPKSLKRLPLRPRLELLNTPR